MTSLDLRQTTKRDIHAKSKETESKEWTRQRERERERTRITDLKMSSGLTSMMTFGDFSWQTFLSRVIVSRFPCSSLLFSRRRHIHSSLSLSLFLVVDEVDRRCTD
jgi:hypothetical protein